MRHLYFVRHGHYHKPDSPDGKLTAIGRRQARRTGRRLASVPIEAIHGSDLMRAAETPFILAEALGGLSVKRSKVLREMHPTSVPGVQVPLETRRRGKRNLDAIVSRYFRTSRRECHEVVVCHGNLIRSLACHALGVRLTAWLQLDARYRGITHFIVRDGSIRMVSYNDTGHLPVALVTG